GAAVVPGTRQRLGELVEAAPRHVDQEIVAVAEMPVRRGRTDARPARGLGEREPGRPLAGDQVERRLDQRLLEVPVMVAARTLVIPPAHVKDIYMSRGRASPIIAVLYAPIADARSGHEKTGAVSGLRRRGRDLAAVRNALRKRQRRAALDLPDEQIEGALCVR